jgi:hypothetical protein
MWLHESLDAVADVSLEAFEIAGTSIRRGPAWAEDHPCRSSDAALRDLRDRVTAATLRGHTDADCRTRGGKEWQCVEVCRF